MFRSMMDVRPEALKALLYQLLSMLDDGVRGALEEATVGVVRKMSRVS